MPDKLDNYSRNTFKEFVGNADLRSLLSFYHFLLFLSCNFAAFCDANSRY